MTSFIIFGTAVDEDLYFCHHVAKRIQGSSEGVTITFDVMGELDYLSRIDGYKASHGGKFLSHTSTHAVLRDDKLVGDIKAIINLARTEYGDEEAGVANSLIFNKLAKEESVKILNNPERSYVFLDFMDGSPKRTKLTPEYGKVIIELFNDLCPVAAENFLLLCSGKRANDSLEVKFHYEGAAIHRLVTDGWLQCGDIKDGSGGHSVAAAVPMGEFLPDESFAADFGFPKGGIVGYANNGPHTNGSQFFITLGPCEWMNTKYVGVGRVIFGFNVLRRINAAKTLHQRPAPEIVVGQCGVEI